MGNLRNYYQLLHVQHDAPTAVIKGSYRTMMQTLRHHPDLGGDEQRAQLLNEAMRTLGDPLLRTRYDEALTAQRARWEPRDAPAAAERTASSEAEADAADDAAARAEPSAGVSEGDVGKRRTEGVSALATVPPVFANADPSCPFCGAVVGTASHRGIGAYGAHATCSRCGGPTRAPDTRSGTADRRRRSHRVEHETRASVERRRASDAPIAVALGEFSATGCSFRANIEFDIGEVVLLRADEITAIGTVRSCFRSSERGEPLRIGLEFLTVEMRAAPGSVFSTRA